MSWRGGVFRRCATGRALGRSGRAEGESSLPALYSRRPGLLQLAARRRRWRAAANPHPGTDSWPAAIRVIILRRAPPGFLVSVLGLSDGAAIGLLEGFHCRFQVTVGRVPADRHTFASFPPARSAPRRPSAQ